MMGAATSPEFDPFALEISFDINTAFQEAATTILSDEAIALEERVSRVRTILSEAKSETYEAFVDFRMLAAQVEMYCSHDHAFSESLSQSSHESTLSYRLDSHNDRHYSHEVPNEKIDKKKDKKESKKKKDDKNKRKSWFGFYY